MGLAFLLQTVYLLPITVVALAFVLGLLAVTLLVVGKFAVKVDVATYGGVGFLIVASVWNSWPTKPA